MYDVITKVDLGNCH